MIKVIRKSEASVRKITDNKIVLNYITKDISPDVSFAITQAKNYSEKETIIYNRVYYVLEGTLLLSNNGQEISLGEGDSCFLEKGTEYTMKGTFKAIIVNQPAFGT